MAGFPINFRVLTQKFLLAVIFRARTCTHQIPVAVNVVDARYCWPELVVGNVLRWERGVLTVVSAVPAGVENVGHGVWREVQRAVVRGPLAGFYFWQFQRG